MTLEKKIALLPPDLREEAEHYVDYLLVRAGKDPEGSIERPEPEDNEAGSLSSGPTEGRDFPGMRGKTAPSGIILAEEQPVSEDPDYIDFADINSRFGNTDENAEKEEEKPRRSITRRMLDWM
ncbi:MAG: DUF2281 domain-containing protein [Methanospirillum sp.]|nr:DUF2281 domain-containing protein [Methanospirillum sp.]